MRSMVDLLLKFVNKIPEINKKIAQIDKRTQTYDNTICINNIKDKDKGKCVNENILTKVYIEQEKKLIDNNNWTQKKLSRYFGIIILYLKYVKIGYSIVITMHT